MYSFWRNVIIAGDKFNIDIVFYTRNAVSPYINYCRVRLYVRRVANSILGEICYRMLNVNTQNFFRFWHWAVNNKPCRELSSFVVSQTAFRVLLFSLYCRAFSTHAKVQMQNISVFLRIFLRDLCECLMLCFNYVLRVCTTCVYRHTHIYAHIRTRTRTHTPCPNNGDGKVSCSPGRSQGRSRDDQ